MFKELLAWWVAQMRDLLPASWRGTTDGPANALVYTIEPGPPAQPLHVVASERRRGHETEMLSFPLDSTKAGLLGDLHRRCGRRLPIVLRPPPGWALEREVVLPAAAAEDLSRVLAYEMDRFTPFRAEDVIWDYQLLARDRRSGMLRARLSVVPRAGFGELVSLLEQAGTPAGFVECQPANGIVRSLRLEPAETPRQRRQRRLRLAAGWTCLVLTLAVVATPFVRQLVAQARIERRIADLQPAVDRAEALRARIAKAASGNEAIASQAARDGDALAILAALTQILPDDSYLTSLTMRDGTVTMEGQSTAAAKLISALANTKLFAEPAFMAPVTRTDRGIDIFALSAKIVPGAEAGSRDPR